MFCFAFHTSHMQQSQVILSVNLKIEVLSNGWRVFGSHASNHILLEWKGLTILLSSWVVWTPFKLRKKSSLDLVMVTADGIWRQKLCFPSGWLWNVSPFSNLVYWYHFHRACFFVCMSSYGSLYCMKASDRREWKCLPADLKLYADTGDQHGACALT